MKKPKTRAIQDYLKVIYKLQESGQPVTTSEVAKRMSVSSPSATNMLKRLARMRLVTHRPYHGVQLTDAGRKVALEVIRHHRLLERYLAEALGLSLDQVHAEAEQLEHALSEELEEHIDRTLGHPTSDPHGDPIPTRDGTVRKQHFPTLAELEPPLRVVVRRVSDDDPAQLRHLTDLGLVPGVPVSVLEKLPFDGPVRVEAGGREHVLSPTLAQRLFMERVTQAPERAKRGR